MGAPLFWRLWHSVQAMLSSFLAFAKLGTRKGLLRYGIDTRCAKQPPVVRDAFSEAFGVKNRLSGTEGIFGAKNSLLWYATHLQRPAEQPTPQTVDSPLPHRTHLQCAKRPPLGGD